MFRLQTLVFRYVVALLVMLALASCTDSPSEVETAMPGDVNLSSTEQAAYGQESNPFVTFAPPLGQQAISSDVVPAPELQEFLKIEICPAQDGECAGPPVAVFGSNTDAGGPIRLSNNDRTFSVNWQSNSGGGGADYRLSLYAGEVLLDWMSFHVQGRRAVVPIRFSVDNRALAHVGAAVIGTEGGVVSEPGERLTLTFPPGALSSSEVIGIRESSAPPPSLLDDAEFSGLAFDLLPSGTAFSEPVTIDFRQPVPDPSLVLAVLHADRNIGRYAVLTPVQAESGRVVAEISTFSTLIGMWLTDEDDEGWTLFRFKWDTSAGPIRWHYRAQSGDVYLNSQRISQALSVWSDAANIDFVEVSSLGQAQLIFDEVPSINLLNACVTFFTHFSYNGQVCFNTSATFTGGRLLGGSDQALVRLARSPALSSFSRQAVLLHEIGHAIGVAHTHKLAPAANSPIMEQRFQSRSDLHPWDIAAAQAHYGPRQTEDDASGLAQVQLISPPNGFEVEFRDGRLLTLSWSPVDDAESYRVEVYRDGQTLVGNTPFTTVGLIGSPVEGEWRWRVRAEAGESVGPWSEVRTFLAIVP